jgi:hypothetical protein
MLFRDPAHDGDGGGVDAAPDADETEHEAPERLYCAACGHEVTRPEWALRLDGAHLHHCVNPMGIKFRVRLFSHAPGAVPLGAPSSRATWFAGFTWKLAACNGCRAHLGWFYEGAPPPRAFFGLNAEALTERPAASGRD